MNIIANRLVASVISASFLLGSAGAAIAVEQPKDTPAPAATEGEKSKDHAKEKSKDEGDKAKGKEKNKDKAKDKAKGLKVGDAAPSFTLKDTDGKPHTLSDLSKDGKIVVIQWFNPDCPFVVKHYGKAGNTFNAMADAWKDKKVVLIGINSGAEGKQGAGLDRNKKAKTDWKISYPILLDETGEVGKSYGSKNTPAMYVIGTDGKIAYMGAIDDDDTTGGPGKTNYVMKAVDELLAGKPVTTASTKPYGCSVKYKD